MAMDEATAGILNPHVKKYEMVRTLPCQDLRPLVEFFYEIRWNLPAGGEQAAESLPAPVVHLVFMDGRVEVHGPLQRRFSYLMRGQGRLFGVKFRPGSFRAVSDAPPSSLVGRRLPAGSILGESIAPVAAAILEAGTIEDRIAISHDYLSSLRVRDDGKLPVIRSIFSCIERHKSVYTVAQLAARQHMTVRTIQRLFRDYVGVTPKWTIQLYRLREAARRMEAPDRPDLTQLALDLGYADQAHFSNHFRRVTGKTPRSYPVP